MSLIMLVRPKHVGNYVNAGRFICTLCSNAIKHNCIISTRFVMNTFKFINVSTFGRKNYSIKLYKMKYLSD